MSGGTPRKPKAGETIDVVSTVTRPDGVALVVTGGKYVLTQTGTYLIDGTEMEVKR